MFGKQPTSANCDKITIDGQATRHDEQIGIPDDPSGDTMTNLNHSLRGQDLGFLRIVASTWGIDLDPPDVSTALPVLTKALSDRHLLQEVYDALPRSSKEALQFLLEHGGQAPWSLFSRRFGEVRAFGPARRDRERPHIKPVSPAEVLWYRALIGKAFLDLPPEPQEYAYIPQDFIDLLPPESFSQDLPPGQPASPAETAVKRLASDAILEHATTLLAALRVELPLESIKTDNWHYPPMPLLQLLQSAGIVDRRNQPQPDLAREFLESSRAQALLSLAQTWLHSPNLNDLRHLPGLVFEGKWQNDPLQAREVTVSWLRQVPPDQWWNLNAFINHIHTQQPDFQRPAGDYDSWSIRRSEDDAYLRGFSSWQAVDGALIRYLVTVPMAALGMIDLATAATGNDWYAFRISQWGQAMLNNLPPEGLAAENGKLRVNPEGDIRTQAHFPRAQRYQVARFCEWLDEHDGQYRYRVTPASLERAASQGLRSMHLVTLLKRAASGQVPSTLIKALERLDKFGVQVSAGMVYILRVATPEMLVELRNSRAGKFIGEGLNPTTAEIKPGGLKDLRHTLAEMGYLGQFDLD